MSRILLLMDDKENQHRLARCLSACHEVLETEAQEDLDREFDLCILDGPALRRLEPRVRARKEREQPAFLPVLLVTIRGDLRQTGCGPSHNVDDLVVSAAEEAELQAQAEVLLRARDLSLTAEAQARTLRAVDFVTEAVLSPLPLDELLRNLLGRIKKVLGADTATVLLATEDGEQLAVRASVGLEEEAEEQVLIPVGHGLVGRILADRKPLAVEDLSEVDVVPPILRQRIRSLLGVPLLVDGRAIGVLHVGTVDRRSFGPDDERLLELVAQQVAFAPDRARADAERERLLAGLNATMASTANLVREVSHDLRNPLAVVQGQALTIQMLLEKSGQHGQLRKSVESIVTSARRMNTMIQDLVDMARADSRQLQLKRTPVELRPYLGEHLQLHAARGH